MALDRAHDERAWLAWHTAMLGRVKEFPKLEKLLHRQKPKREMTPDEMWALMVPLTYSQH